MWPLPLLALAAALPSRAQAADGDPFDSGMWATHRTELLGDPADIRFDDAVSVLAAEYAEDAAHVPVLVDARAVGPVRRIVVTADYSPIPKVLEFHPGSAAPLLGFGFKVEQATPLRVAVERAAGDWRVGGALIGAAGGGCTAPAASHSRPDWQQNLGVIRARLWADGRLRLRVTHPMDTGLADGIPAFFLRSVTVLDAAGQELTRVVPFEPVEEDPSLTLQLPEDQIAAGVTIHARDNNGNDFRVHVAPGDHG